MAPDNPVVLRIAKYTGDPKNFPSFSIHVGNNIFSPNVVDSRWEKEGRYGMNPSNTTWVSPPFEESDMCMLDFEHGS